MLVNHIQVAYVLQITPLEAKFMLAPHIERIREMVIPGKKGLDECARLVRETDVVESLLLNIRFRHPSPELDGKDRIAYTIEKLKEAPQYPRRGIYKGDKRNTAPKRWLY